MLEHMFGDVSGGLLAQERPPRYEAAGRSSSARSASARSASADLPLPALSRTVPSLIWPARSRPWAKPSTGSTRSTSTRRDAGALATAVVRVVAAGAHPHGPPPGCRYVVGCPQAAAPSPPARPPAHRCGVAGARLRCHVRHGAPPGRGDRGVEGTLAQLAVAANPADVRRAVRHVADIVDPDGTEAAPLVAQGPGASVAGSRCPAGSTGSGRRPVHWILPTASPALRWELSAADARRLAQHAKVTAVLTMGPWRPVSVGRTQRTLPGRLRPVLVAVHGHCRGARPRPANPVDPGPP